MTPDNHPAKIAELIAEDPWLHVGGKLSDDYKVIATQEIDSGRWERYDLMVIEGPYGSLWGVEYATGLTECQDDTEPFGYDGISPELIFPVRTVPTISYERAE